MPFEYVGLNAKANGRLIISLRTFDTELSNIVPSPHRFAHSNDGRLINDEMLWGASESIHCLDLVTMTIKQVKFVF